MTELIPTQIEAEKREQAQTIALTYRQIDAAIRMWRDPQNWRLIMTGVGKRCLYVREVVRNASN